MSRNGDHAKRLVPSLAFLIAVLGCGSDGGNGPGPGPGPDYSCGTEADSILALANAELEDVLYEQLNRTGDIEHPSEVDFRAAQDLYQNALSVDADCPVAHFGAAITELLTLSVDPAVTDAFDEWKTYLDANLPFEVETSGKRPLGIPITLAPGKESLALPLEIVPLSILAIARASMMAPREGVPRIGQVQALLESTVLPRANQAIYHLDQVAMDSAFTFRVSGRMQGDQEEDATYIDRTDVLALRAGCNLLAAAINVAIAYNLELEAYDSLTLYQAIQPGSGWFTLKNDGSAKMGAAYDRLMDATDDLDATIASLLAEGDPQFDDVIRIGPDDRSSNWDVDGDDVDSIRYNLDNFRDAMENGYTRTDDWDGDDDTPPEALRLHFRPFFIDPVEDWKELLPEYAGTIKRVGWEFPDEHVSWDTTIVVDCPVSGYYSAGLSLDVYQGEEDFWTSSWGATFLHPALEAILAAELENVRGDVGWTGWYRGSAEVAEQYIEAGTRSVNVSASREWETTDHFVYIPVVTWEAESFEEWTWPYPDMKGLLPEMETTEDLWQVFGIEAEQWERTWDLDWTEGEWDWDLDGWDVGEEAGD